MFVLIVETNGFGGGSPVLATGVYDSREKAEEAFRYEFGTHPEKVGVMYTIVQIGLNEPPDVVHAENHGV
jgi:hypothetical protein